ncbi:MAG TPA: FAD-binding oxidoreductase, partial [Candidatus Dormibacteraeota bacterium]|nr:FAD-binding oxidoreductase [Candidatus Dormibacteraeota bacterium]
TSRRGLVARGLGRSYGDAAQNGGGDVALMTSLTGILELDRQVGRVRVQAGMSLDALMRAVIPLGWFVPVTPGTRHVTVGGAVAADIHGKNHHRDGSFCMYVDEIDLHTPAGRRVVRPDLDPDLFWATAGGMGLTGVMTEVALRLMPIETSLMRVDTDRAENLEAAMAMMEEGDARYRYTVAWIDCLARGAHMGRAVLTRGDHAALDEISRPARRAPLRFAPASRLRTPPLVPRGILNRLTIAAFNEALYRKAPRHEVGRMESIAHFFHPLDGVKDWNRMYGPDGFLQYQVAVPFGAEETIRHCIAAFSATGAPSFLAVLKRFGAASPGHLSFPIPGWTLALDFPARIAGLGPLMDRLDEAVATAGGRIYLAKDSRLRPGLVPQMYPRLEEWRRVQASVDPGRRMQSDLSRRLRLLDL